MVAPYPDWNCRSRVIRASSAYDPAELVVTARAGTRLADLEALLQAHGQRLPFEPPAFGAAATIGGTVAAGLAGPARVARGPVRDYVLGVRLLASDGRVLRFGGEVIKNVAGYDVSRLLAGSLGILGVILDVSLKVLPVPAGTLTLLRRLDANAAIEHLATATQLGAPVTGSFWCDGELHVRLEGSDAALAAIERSIGGDRLPDAVAGAFWRDVREQTHPFFARDQALWRVTTSVSTPFPDASPGRLAFEWNGLQRWAVGDDARQVPDVAGSRRAARQRSSAPRAARTAPTARSSRRCPNPCCACIVP